MNKQSQLKIFAHRGASTIYPENTMAAFQQALQDGADGIELDVHLSLDQQVVVIHDETIDRTSTGKGPVGEMTFQQLRQYNYCAEFDEKHPKEWFDIPSLEEVLQFLLTNHLQCNIELKTDIVPYPQIESQVVNLIKQYQLQERIIISSFNIESLILVNQIMPQVATALLTDTTEDILKKLEVSQAQSLHLDYRVYHPNIDVKDCPIRLWTVNNGSIFQSYLLSPIDAIMTDDVKKIVDILHGGGHDA